MNDFINALSEQFEKHQLFRRMILFIGIWLVFYTTAMSFNLAHNSQYTGLEVAGIITAIQVPVTSVFAFLSKLYWSKR